MSHESEGSTREGTRLRDVPCPRCGCCVVRHFECGCGAVHDDYCDNCDRFASLPEADFTEIGPTDARCEHGAVLHAHAPEEKTERIEAWYASLRGAS